MKQSRESVYETNSSSSHSLTIATGNFDTDYSLQNLINSEGFLILKGGEYGWGPDEYRDVAHKANYCAVGESGNPLQKILLRNIIAKKLGLESCNVLIEFTSDSYIDHQSGDIYVEAFKTEDGLRSFIFNRESILTIDNDNG